MISVYWSLPAAVAVEQVRRLKTRKAPAAAAPADTERWRSLWMKGAMQ
jgi:hypothetical protein